jgi:predicted nucleic acid-binding protein
MILDSCILIDVSRENPAALGFTSSLQAVPSISTLTVLEVSRGVRSAKEKALFDQIFEEWTIIPVTLEISLLAATFIKTYHASHRVDTVDAVIAATAQLHNLSLITLNLKHFPMFPGLARPY